MRILSNSNKKKEIADPLVEKEFKVHFSFASDLDKKSFWDVVRKDFEFVANDKMRIESIFYF